MRNPFKDRSGHLVLYQWPNPPLWAWIGAAGVSLVAEGRVGDIADLVAFGASFTWAWMELFDGVTPFRRVLGAGVLVWTVVSRLP